MLWAGIFMNSVAHARVQDWTLDFAPPAQQFEQSDDALYFRGADPWSTFFGQLSGFNEVKFWGLALDGLTPHRRNPTLPLIPASLQKMITTASALRNLGGDAQFSNYFDADLEHSTGELLHPKFTVSGDPTWGHGAFEGMQDRLARVILELKARGVTRVVGPISIVELHPELNRIPTHSAWPKRWTLQCMATQMTAFMFNGNCGSIQVKSLTSAVWTTPGVDIPITLKITKSSVNQLMITPTLNAQGRVQSYLISGRFAKPTSTFFDPLQNEETSSVPVHLGSRWLSNLFRLMLSENGIAYTPVARLQQASQLASSPLWVDLSSLPLLDLLRVAVSESVNSILDRTFFEIALQTGTSRPADPSFRVMREVVNNESLFAGVALTDGSGLAMDNRIRADLLNAFLARLELQPYFDEFLSTLSVAGVSGTLATRLGGPLTYGKIFGKTGTIDGIYNLAGYFKTQSETYEPFTIISESSLSAPQVRGMIDKIATEFSYLNTPN